MPKRKTHEEFVEEVRLKYGNEYTVLGKYISTHKGIKLKHNICGNIWDTTAPYDFLKPRSNTCPECSHPSKRKTDKEFKLQIKTLVGNEYTFLEPYEINRKAIKVKHNICNNIYSVKPGNFIRGTRCPICARKKIESRGIIKIKEILQNNNIRFYQELKIKDKYTTRMDKCLKFDFFIRKINLAIEFDGEQHFKPKRGGEQEFEKTQKRDKRKNEFCKRKNIDLLRIAFWDEKKIKSILRNKFKEYGIKII